MKSLTSKNKMYFSTERLIVRELSTSDLNDFHLLQSDPRVFLYTGTKPATDISENKKELLAHISAYKQMPGRWIMAIEELENASFCGTCALYINPDGEYEVGYRILPSHWNKGLASELLPKLIEFSLKICGKSFVCAYVFSDHRASIKVIEKSNMKLVREFYNETYQRMDRYYRSQSKYL
jgi:ribosomal-protein-alanine N-acetyltransferase